MGNTNSLFYIKMVNVFDNRAIYQRSVYFGSPQKTEFKVR